MDFVSRTVIDAKIDLPPDLLTRYPQKRTVGINILDYKRFFFFLNFFFLDYKSTAVRSSNFMIATRCRGNSGCLYGLGLYIRLFSVCRWNPLRVSKLLLYYLAIVYLY